MMDAWGNEGEEENCLTCDGTGIEYDETCVTCGGLGFTCWPMKLSERVEKATGDYYSLRVEIAEALGWTKNPVGGVIAWYAPEEPGIMKAGPPKWLTSLDAAMTLVPEGFVLHNLQETPTIVHEEHTGWEPLPNWQATLLRQDCAGYRNRKKFMQAFEHGGGNTAALALCAAALKARGL